MQQPSDPKDVAVFYELTRILGAHPNHKGMVKAPCPECGDTKGHFEFNEHWGHCVKCGTTIGLTKLGRLYEANGDRPPPRPFVPRKPKKRLPWQDDPSILDSYKFLPPDALNYYRARGFTDASIYRWRLGYGSLPKGSARCDHLRYILPVFEDDKLVAIKGRRIDAICDHAKWLPAAGSKSVLFGAEELRDGCTLVITAAPYNAILAMQFTPGLVAVAPSNGEAQWSEEWTARIVKARPSGVIIAYDKDDTGERAYGKVRAALVSNNIRSTKFQWPRNAPAKYDLADYVLEHGSLPIRVAPDQRVNPKYVAGRTLDGAMRLAGWY